MACRTSIPRLAWLLAPSALASAVLAEASADACSAASDEATCRAAAAAEELAAEDDFREEKVSLLQSRAKQQKSPLAADDRLLHRIEGFVQLNSTESSEDLSEGGFCEDSIYEAGGTEWMNGYDCRKQGYKESDGCGTKGWTCEGYKKQGWCKDGAPVEGQEYAFGRWMHNPVGNCCECGKATQTCKVFGCHTGYVKNQPCQCTSTCRKYNNCCGDKAWTCDHYGPPPATAPAPTPPPPTAHSDATLCAREDGTCKCNGQVFYTQGTWSSLPDAVKAKAPMVTKEVYGEIGCNNKFMGKDPIPGQLKACWCEVSHSWVLKSSHTAGMASNCAFIACETMAAKGTPAGLDECKAKATSLSGNVINFVPTGASGTSGPGRCCVRKCDGTATADLKLTREWKGWDVLAYEESGFQPPAPLPSPRPPPVPAPPVPAPPSGPPNTSPDNFGPPAPSPQGGPPAPAPSGGNPIGGPPSGGGAPAPPSGGGAPAPGPVGGAASCSAHSGCAALGLAGDCCPAPNGVMLGCC